MSIGSSLWGLITGADKKKKYPDQQAKFLGRGGNFTIIYPYGSHCDLPVDTLIKQVAEDAAIPVTIDRPGGIEQGEPVFFHPVKMSYITFRNNGDIEIITDADVNVQCNDVNIDCNDATINCNDATIDCTNLYATATAAIDLTAPIIDLTAINTTITGNLIVTGITTLASAVTSAGVDISFTHTHGGTQPGSGSTGTPN